MDSRGLQVVPSGEAIVKLRPNSCVSNLSLIQFGTRFRPEGRPGRVCSNRNSRWCVSAPLARFARVSPSVRGRAAEGGRGSFTHHLDSILARTSHPRLTPWATL